MSFLLRSFKTALVLPFLAALAISSYFVFAQTSLDDKTAACIINIVGEVDYEAFKAGTKQPTEEQKQQIQAQCFSTTITQPPPSPTLSEKEACIVAAVGQERFTAFRAGTASPTEAEKALISKCFVVDTTLPPTVVVTPPKQFQSDSSAMKCLKEVLGEARFSEVISGRAQPTQEESQKGASCFSTKPGAIPPPAARAISPTLELCLKSAIGEDRFKAISSGADKPTAEEQQKGRACFESSGQVPVVHPPTSNEELELVQCVRLALGDERFNVLKTGTPPTLEERQKIEVCMGGNPHPIAPPAKVAMSQELVACFKNAVGENRFNAISSGQSFPTAAERTLGYACFKAQEAKITDISVKTLSSAIPVAAAVVPYAPIDSTKITLQTTSTTTTSITVNGTASAGAIVDIYIYSDPQVTSVQADGNGKWSYTASGLPKGEHTALAAVRDEKGDLVRSEEIAFNIGEEAKKVTEVQTAIWTILAGFGLIALAVLGVLFWRRRPSPL